MLVDGVYVARHNSEREVGHYWPDGRYDGPSWEDCAWNGLGMVRDVATGGASSPTHTQMEAVRALVMGPDGPTGSGMLLAGARQAWGWAPASVPYTALFAAVWSRIPVGGAADLMGVLSMFPAGHRLRRHQPGYTGGHAVGVVKLPDGSAWWDDPLAPIDYVGERVSIAEMTTFYGGLRVPGADTIYAAGASAPILQGVEMYPVIHQLDYPKPRQFTIPAGTTIVGYDPATPNARYGEQLWTVASSGEVIAEAGIDWRNGRPSAPDSGAFDPANPVRPFLLVRGDAAYGGAYKGRWIIKSLVELAPLPAGATPTELATAKAEGYASGKAEAKTKAVGAAGVAVDAIKAI